MINLLTSSSCSYGQHGRQNQASKQKVTTYNNDRGRTISAYKLR